MNISSPKRNCLTQSMIESRLKPIFPSEAPKSLISVSIIIKALNEEVHIARAIESALAALERINAGEVILADSLSKDRTIEIASSYPIRIIQLADPEDRSCGVGAQLGMSIAKGDYIYIMDADMELDADFLPCALETLNANPQLAGVAGLLREMHTTNEEFRRRHQQGDQAIAKSDLWSLDGGGLYRRTAIESVGYLTNRNLHGYEEFELGLRLVKAGWKLERVNITSVRHFGHTDTSSRLLLRRWRSRYSWGPGELIRQIWGSGHLTTVLRLISSYRVGGFVLISWGLLLALAAFQIPALIWLVLVAAYWALVWGLQAYRRKSLTAAIYALVAWHFTAAGTVCGLLARPRGAAGGAIPHRELK